VSDSDFDTGTALEMVDCLGSAFANKGTDWDAASLFTYICCAGKILVTLPFTVQYYSTVYLPRKYWL